MSKSKAYTDNKNYLLFYACNKPQNVETDIELILINGKVLRTTSSVEVIVK